MFYVRRREGADPIISPVENPVQGYDKACAALKHCEAMSPALCFIFGNVRMWRFLPVLLLTSCAVPDQQQPAGSAGQSSEWRIVRQTEISLEPSTEAVGGQPAKMVFRSTDVRGWLDVSGSWHFKAEVRHNRLRCATYQTGIQLGLGNTACSDVSWVGGVEYATRLRHCNSAARLHVGSGTSSDRTNGMVDVSCVRVVVRCDGIC